METAAATARFLLPVLVAGQFAWIVSEGIELAVGRVTATRWLTISTHIAIAIGVWGVQAAHGADRRRLGLVATLLASVGYAGFAVPLTIAALDAGASMPALVGGQPLFLALGMLSVIGTTAIGLLVVARRRLPRWAGAALVVLPWLALYTHAADLPHGTNQAVSIVQAIAWLHIAVAGWRAIPRETPSSGVLP